MTAPQVTIVGGGMIVRTQILPTLFHMQRTHRIGEIHICSQLPAHIAELRSSPTLARAFPGQGFIAHPDPDKVPPGSIHPELYRDVLKAAPRHSIAVIATPDQIHYPMICEALNNDLHVCTVKPLVLKHDHAEDITHRSHERGLLVGIEYHKRFDHRSLMARQAYRAGRLGEFRLGQAFLHEPYYYRDSNFQNWCTCKNTDMFTYVGCHYVDLVAFITGLRPVSVSVCGIRDRYPNGNEGFLWTDGRVRWENGAILSVANAIGYPSGAAGGNAQGLTMWCQGKTDATLIEHSDAYRGVTYHYTSAGNEPGDTTYAEPNPDYFQLLDTGGPGLTPVGYGHRSVKYIIEACCRASQIAGLDERRALVAQLDREGIMATPANSSYNELVIEAARKSILTDGREVLIQYGDRPAVAFRDYSPQQSSSQE